MIATERLLLRPWVEHDLPMLHAMHADPRVMAHFGGIPTPTEVNERLARFRQWERAHGFTFWLVTRRTDGEPLGTCGLKPLTVPWPCPSDIEIGWMFRAEYQRNGYATEAARAALALGLRRAPRVIAMTARTNIRSRQVMERLGMRHVADLDFDHPQVAEGSPFRPHIVFAAEAG